MRRELFEKKPINFNITGVIDIVFLLIIFFMVVCQFITNQNFEVAVPDDVSSADKFDSGEKQNPTVTVMPTETGIAYAVDAELLDAPVADLADSIAAALNARFDNDSESRIVSLRIDKNISYKDCQYALAGVSKSNATGMELAVLRDSGN